MYGPEQDPQAAATSATTAMAAAARDGWIGSSAGPKEHRTAAAHEAATATAHQTTQGPSPALTSRTRSASARIHEPTALHTAVPFQALRCFSTATTIGRTARVMASSIAHIRRRVLPYSGTSMVVSPRTNVPTSPTTSTASADHSTTASRRPVVASPTKAPGVQEHPAQKHAYFVERRLIIAPVRERRRAGRPDPDPSPFTGLLSAGTTPPRGVARGLSCSRT
ncbi:hypothetical protein ACXNSR_00595 [Streptomyces sp. NC-S4]